jgi:hypothetical protein
MRITWFSKPNLVLRNGSLPNSGLFSFKVIETWKETAHEFLCLGFLVVGRAALGSTTYIPAISLLVIR